MIITKNNLKIYEYICLFAAVFLIGLILSDPAVCARGAKIGITLCGGVLIPSLFPFAVPVIFIINASAFKETKHKVLFVFLLSLIGGYPIGAKLISELYKSGGIDIKTAKKILPFCINAGPAFVVIAVGRGILKNIILGYILLAAQSIAAVLIAVCFIRRELFTSNKCQKSIAPVSAADNLVLSVSSAAGATITLCSYVIIFSVINEYINTFSNSFAGLKYLIFITEITSATKSTDNIYIISFLLGFAGASILLQVVSLTDCIKVSAPRLIVFRVLHGALSALLTKFMITTFGVFVPTVSNGVAAAQKPVYTSVSLTVSLIIMALLFIIGLGSKKFSGNILKDML